MKVLLLCALFLTICFCMASAQPLGGEQPGAAVQDAKDHGHHHVLRSLPDLDDNENPAKGGEAACCG